MPYLLILLSLVFVSCGKKENALSKSEFTSSLEQRTFITIKHEDGKSIIRSKILNKFVEEKTSFINLAAQINKGDEIIGSDMDQRDLKIYADNEKILAKIVVSFTDHEEIFFLPEYVPLKVIPAKLNLKPEADRVLKWVKTEALKTYSGGTFYLASVNTNDIVENDQNVYQETIDLQNRFASVPLKLSNGKLLEFTFNYDFYIQKETAGSFSGRSLKCTRDAAEAGMCGGCTYNRNVPSSEYEKTTTAPISDLGLSMRVGGKIFKMSELSSELVNANQFKIKLDAKNFEMRNELEVVIDPISVTSVGKITAGYNYSDTCVGRSESAPISLQRKVETNVIVKISGRGFEALKNIL